MTDASADSGAASPSDANDPKRVGPVKLLGELPEPVEHVEAKVGPVKLRSESPTAPAKRVARSTPDTTTK